MPKRVTIEGYEFEATEEDATVRDLLDQSLQGAVDSGRFELVDDKTRVVDIDSALPADGLRLSVRRVALPEIWAGAKPWTALRKRLFVAVPSKEQKYAKLHLAVVATLRDAGYRAVYAQEAESILGWLKRVATESTDAVTSGVVVISDSSVTELADDAAEDWARTNRISMRSVDLLLERRRRGVDAADDYFKRLMPVTGPGVWAGEELDVGRLCHRVLLRAAADMDIDLDNKDAHTKLAAAACDVAGHVSLALTPEQGGCPAARSLDTFLKVCFQRTSGEGMHAIRPEVLRNHAAHAGLLAYVSWHKIQGYVETVPLSLKKGIEWAEFRQAYCG